MLQGNRGEWSELYVFLKLLGDGVMYAADGNLEKIDDLYYPIIKVFREESETALEYRVHPGEHVVELVDVTSGANKPLVTLDQSRFRKMGASLLNSIRDGKGAFSVSDVDSLCRACRVSRLKASSVGKSDITMVVHDMRTGSNPTLGFSIKSKLGSPATLLNAGATTNFVYRVEGVSLSPTEIRRINALDSPGKVRARINELVSAGAQFRFVGTQGDMLSLNMQLVDSSLPEIFAAMLLLYYRGEGTSVDNLIQLLDDTNPLQYAKQYGHQFYKYKVKKFLTEVALGMVPSVVWDGSYDATGGYIVVREDGEVVCYHLYNRNEFEEYLFRNTKLDTASTGRHGFGEIYEAAGGGLLINLNLQIRFR